MLLIIATIISLYEHAPELTAQYPPQDEAALAKYHLEHCRQDIVNNNLQGAILHCQSASRHIKSATLIYGSFTTNQTNATNQTLSNSNISKFTQANETSITSFPVILRELCAINTNGIYNQTSITTGSQLINQLDQICEPIRSK